MDTLTLLFIILGLLFARIILRIILKAISPVKLRTYKIKNSNWYIVNVKSIKQAIKIAKEEYGYAIVEEELEEVDINISKQFNSQIIDRRTITMIAKPESF